MKTVLHIFPYTIFAVNYVNSFGMDRIRRHMFYFYGDYNILSSSEMKFHDEAEIFFEEDNTQLLVLRILVGQADDIVLQCLPERATIAAFLMEYLESSKKNLIIYPWGRELYKTSDLYRTGKKDIIETVDKAKDYFVRNCDAIIISKFGYEYVINNYKTNCNFRIMFNAVRVVSSDEILGFCKEVGEQHKTRVMVGHRGTKSSCHEAGFLFLKKMNKPLSVICPLSIGDKEYIKDTIELGKHLFNEDFFYIEEWMPKKDYYYYIINNVDIGVFPTITTEAIVTILFLIGHGIKVYINRQSETYWLFKELGFVIFPFNKNEIEEDFLTPLSEKEKRVNREVALRYTSVENFLENWDYVLSHCENLRK